MAKGAGSVAQRVWEIAEPLADEIGIWIWDVEFVKEGARRSVAVPGKPADDIPIGTLKSILRESGL